jgi:hypothetical protein
LTISGDGKEWFWTAVNASGHELFCVLSERWHKETNNFHLPVGEMTVTPDDVTCLLDIPITRRLIEEEEISYEQGR